MRAGKGRVVVKRGEARRRKGHTSITRRTRSMEQQVEVHERGREKVLAEKRLTPETVDQGATSQRKNLGKRDSVRTYKKKA